MGITGTRGGATQTGADQTWCYAPVLQAKFCSVRLRFSCTLVIPEVSPATSNPSGDGGRLQTAVSIHSPAMDQIMRVVMPGVLKAHLNAAL
ncbi:hypothetical protein GCM10008955_06470 [Deinococcus malanensis]|uniref:Uncharacterized protein n=1 Tax=Deinococcus malanensis TaxID=1706855 RepID=A0ABQ2ENW1_9DEIO|nr:hypothetical protein GCM10008955_06470 [Deinococcus malanensis]